MNRWLKRIFLTLLALLLVLVVAVLALPLVIDPNSLKGPIERIAASRDIHLELEDITWQFYPELGLSLQGLVIAPKERPQQPLARAEQGTAAVALWPLFSGAVEVNELLLDGLAVNLVVDEQGHGNWESLGGGGEKIQPGPEEQDQTERGPINASVERISVRNSSLVYEDRRSGATSRLEDISLQVSDLNVESRPFPLRGDLVMNLSGLPQPLALHLEGRLASDNQLKRLAFTEGRVRAEVPEADEAGFTAGLSGQLDLADGLAYQGQLKAEPFNPKALLSALGQPLPPTSDPAALTDVAFAASFSGDGTALKSEDLSLQLDDTSLQGKLALRLPEQQPPTVTLALAGDGIDVDRYLPPEEAPAGPGQGGTVAPSGDNALPLEALRAVNASLALSLNELRAMDLLVANPKLKVNGENGLWKLNEFTADFYQGQLRSNGQLDARGNTASAELTARMDGLGLEPLLMDVAEFGDLSGKMSGELQARTQAATASQLLGNLSAAFVFTSPELTFQGVNAEYFYCEMASQLGDSDMPDQQWPARTQIDEVEGRLLFEHSRLSIASLVAYVENLVLTASGYLDLNSMDYRVRLPMRLAQQQTSPAGCLIKSRFLVNRDVDVVGCSGSLANLNLGEQCGLDRDAVANLATQAVRYNVEKRTTEKKEEVREKLQEKLREKLGGDEEAESAKDLLRNLLNR